MNVTSITTNIKLLIYTPDRQEGYLRIYNASRSTSRAKMKAMSTIETTHVSYVHQERPG